MSNPYTKDLSLDLVYKLQSSSVYSLSKVSSEWARLIASEFWMCKFIRSFGASLPNGVDYEREYLFMEKLGLKTLYTYVVRKDYIKLLNSMLGKWAAPEDLITIAAYNDNLEIVKILLANGADIHAQEDLALINAAIGGDIEIVKLLLNNGADIHAQEDYVLIVAAQNGHLEIVKILLDNGADIHAHDDYSLSLAAQNGHPDMVKLLLANGSNIHALNDKALRQEAYYGHLEIVKLLLDNGADIRVIQNNKYTKEIKELIMNYKKSI